MSGKDLIETLVRGTYIFALNNEDIFSFVEQCSACPTLQESVRHSECSSDVFSLIHDYQRRGVIRTYSDLNIAAVLFAPVRFMAMNRKNYADPEKELRELIAMMQEMLLY